jgi:esterase FrsA
MLTLDMPSIGFSSKWTLNQDTSLLHQHALRHLENVPWVDHTRVAAFGFRFGANIAVRLGYLEPQRLKAWRVWAGRSWSAGGSAASGPRAGDVS